MLRYEFISFKFGGILLIEIEKELSLGFPNYMCNKIKSYTFILGVFLG